MPKRILWVWRLFFSHMKTTQFLLTFFIGLLLAPLHPAHPHAVNGEENHSMVDILDPELRKRVAASFLPPKAPNDPITANDMENVESVRADGPDIRHLTGLEHAINLTDLRLLRTRPRTQAELNARPRFDLTPLAGLTKLERLRLYGVIISDMAPLRNLTELKDLALNYTYGISEIPDLSKLTELVHLQLENNQITDISGVRGLTNLRQLKLGGNRNLSDLTPLATLRNLEILRLDATLVTHASLSAVLPFMSTEIDQMTINEYPPVAVASGVFGITNTNIADLSVLDSLPNVFLSNLYLRFMGKIASRTIFFHLTDLTPLVELMNKGKVINSQTAIYLANNYGLDYASRYEDLPALITGSRQVEYVQDNIPMLEIEPPPPSMVEIDLQEKTEASYRGHPRTRYTFSVRAVNTHPTFPESWLGLTPHGTGDNRQFAEAPVTFTVTNPDGTTETHGPVLTDEDGLAGVTITLGSDGDTYTVEAVVPANAPIPGEIEHPELRVTFTVRADRTVPPPLNSQPERPDRLTVTFEDYPEEKPIDEFTLTIRFSEPVIGFEKADITVDTELTRGKGTATLTALTPETPVRPDRPDPDPVQKYFATVELPDGARGTVKLTVHPMAATGSVTQIRGPLTDTPSDPIKFGRRVIICPPSVVPMDTVIFNEFRNAADDKNDWVELKNISDEPVSLIEWEVSLVLPHAISPVAPQWEIFAMDRDVVAFPDYTLPPGGILLIVNTHPSETDLIRGQNIGNPNRNPDLFPHYLIAPEMKLPNSEFLLILRSVRDKNGQWEGFEDLAGDYHKDDVNYATNIWPLRCTPVYTGTAAPRFSEGDVYQRVMVPKFSSRTLVATLQPEKRGYLKGAWMLSDYHGGLGYRPKVSPEESLGTPGYPLPGQPTEKGWGNISFSEVMYATNDNGGLSQWIELYNNTAESVDLTDWKVMIEARDSKTVRRWTSLRLKPLHIRPNATVLLVGRNARTSGNIPANRIYNLYRHNIAAFRRLGKGTNRFLGSEGFALRLFSPDGTLVDVVGNLDGRQTHDTPKWELPEGWTETGRRTSLIRGYDERLPRLGTLPGSFVRASDTSLLEGYSYWGLPTDDGTPGYRRGSPLPVTVSSVRADRAEGAVVVNWTTASEMENAGFYVLRSQNRTTGFVQVTPSLILGAGTTAERQNYTYRDTTVQPNIPYYYRIEEVSLSGQRRVVTTVRLRGHLSGVGKLLWKWADVKFQD